jgi:hypothetical protein
MGIKYGINLLTNAIDHENLASAYSQFHFLLPVCLSKGNGDHEVEVAASFKLYLQTKLINPHYSPETAAQCTIVNFIVTESGLEDQLLAMVVRVEKPELEAKKENLTKEQQDFII